MAARNGGMKDEPVSPKKGGQKPSVKKEDAHQTSPQRSGMKTRASPQKPHAAEEDS
jgi:hypothetical protein